LGACSDEPSSDATKHNQSLSISSQLVEHKIQLFGGNLVGSKDKITANKGDNVSLVVASDKAINIHLHGYDIEKHIPAQEEVKIEFNANATGRFIITSHTVNDVDVGVSRHGVLFESGTLSKGDTFSYTVGSEIDGITIPYHDHMAHDYTATIKVSSGEGQSGVSEVMINDVGHGFHPMEIVVKPGFTVKWIVDKESRVRLTSGLPPTVEHEEHEGDGEAVLITLEIYP